MKNKKREYFPEALSNSSTVTTDANIKAAIQNMDLLMRDIDQVDPRYKTDFVATKMMIEKSLKFRDERFIRDCIAHINGLIKNSSEATETFTSELRHVRQFMVKVLNDIIQ